MMSRWLVAFCVGTVGAQHEVVQPSPLAAVRAGMVFDAARGVAIVFGGASGQYLSDRTFAWDGTHWRDMQPTSHPPARQAHTMAYDHVRQRIVLFGGMGQGAVPLGDTWEWNGSDWAQIQASGPSPRGRSAMVFDPVRNVMLLFGGSQYIGAVNPAYGDLWQYDGTAWQQVALPAPAPFARAGHMMAFDQARGTVVLFGGDSYSNLSSAEVWEFSGTALTRSTQPGPTPRTHAVLIDVPGPGVALHGGLHGSRAEADSWLWNGSVWTPVSTAGPARGYATACFDTWRGEALVYGGSVQSYDAQHTLFAFGGTWSERAPIPGGTNDAVMLAYDVARQRVFCFDAVGGRVLLGAAGSWTLQPPMAAPSARYGSRLVYDRARQAVLLFGGRANGVAQSDTWEWNGTTWSRLQPVQSPPARSHHAMAFDRLRNRVVLFGGAVGTVWADDTWEWDGLTWLSRNATIRPARRASAAMAFDVSRGASVLYGGNDATGATPIYYADTWTWDGTTWTRVVTVADAGPRSYHGMVEDDDRGHVVIVGGLRATVPLGLETWDFLGDRWLRRGAWSEIQGDCGATYDVGRGRIVAAPQAQGVLELALPTASIAGAGNNLSLVCQGRPALGGQVQMSLAVPGFFVGVPTTPVLPAIAVGGAPWCGPASLHVQPAQVLGFGTNLQISVPNAVVLRDQAVCVQAAALGGACLELSNTWILRVQER